MEYETINMLFNGNHWENITNIMEMYPKTLHVLKKDGEFKVTVEEDYKHELIHKYRTYYEKLNPASINGTHAGIWTPLNLNSEYCETVEECLEKGLDFLNSNQL